jgi:hypothetical protein
VQEKKTEEDARVLIRDYKQLQFDDPFSQDPVDRFRTLRPLVCSEDVHCSDFSDALDRCLAIDDDDDAREAVKHYALGQLVVLAETDVKFKAVLDSKKKLSKNRKKRSERFYDLCQKFPAALGIYGVWGWCEQDGWRKTLLHCFKEAKENANKQGQLSPLAEWPAWARAKQP